jgi:CheY-like chemotaxis protein
MTQDSMRRPWREGPSHGATQSSWLAADDDALLHRIQRVESHEDTDKELLCVVQSDRHFFLRQEAAKRIHDRRLLFGYEDDRHIGQILVRHLTRREDLTYLERLVACSRHAEVRRAAQVQLTRLRSRFATTSSCPPPSLAGASPEAWRVAVLHDDSDLRETVIKALPQPEFHVVEVVPGGNAMGHLRACDPHLVLADVNEVLSEGTLAPGLRGGARYVPLVVLCPPDMTDPLVDVLGSGADEFILLPMRPALLTAKIRAMVHFAHRSSAHAPETADAGRASGDAPRERSERVAGPIEVTVAVPADKPEAVDATLLGWAIHFIVERAWPHLGTVATAGILRRTQRALLEQHAALDLFRVEDNAHVSVDLSQGVRVPRAAVGCVATWMAAFLGEGRRLAPEVAEVQVRRATSLMADALDQVGFYHACDIAGAPATRPLA